MIHLRKATSHVQLETERALWWPVSQAGIRTAIISCPGCGETHGLGDRWRIFPDGVVTPSIDHSWPVKRTDGTIIPSCQFHDNITLDGWST
jgi:hypothetical protein